MIDNEENPPRRPHMLIDDALRIDERRCDAEDPESPATT